MFSPIFCHQKYWNLSYYSNIILGTKIKKNENYFNLKLEQMQKNEHNDMISTVAAIWWKLLLCRIFYFTLEYNLCDNHKIMKLYVKFSLINKKAGLIIIIIKRHSYSLTFSEINSYFLHEKAWVCAYKPKITLKSIIFNTDKM